MMMIVNTISDFNNSNNNNNSGSYYTFAYASMRLTSKMSRISECSELFENIITA